MMTPGWGSQYPGDSQRSTVRLPVLCIFPPLHGDQYDQAGWGCQGQGGILWSPALTSPCHHCLTCLSWSASSWMVGTLGKYIQYCNFLDSQNNPVFHIVDDMIIPAAQTWARPAQPGVWCCGSTMITHVSRMWQSGAGTGYQHSARQLVQWTNIYNICIIKALTISRVSTHYLKYLQCCTLLPLIIDTLPPLDSSWLLLME